MKKRKERKMVDTTFSKYTQIPYGRTSAISGVEWAQMLNKAGLLSHEDIPVFSFASLKQIRKDLRKEGYSVAEIDSTIAGLSELPEYANSERNQEGGR
jgi:N-dimethylarginine dimethylaminohydrolase